MDVFRGMTVAAMILVNNPGDWNNVYGPLLHSAWHGWTPADLVFAFFLFIAGTSAPLSFRARQQLGASRADLARQVLRRGAILLALGLIVTGLTSYQWSWEPGETALHHAIAHARNWRLTGVLQRIAIVYTIAALLALYCRPRVQAAIAAALLLGYWAAATLVPVPGNGATGLAALEDPALTLAAWVDRNLFDWGSWGNHLWAMTDPPGSWDPEGPFSTIPAIATGIFGVLAGHLLGGRQPLSVKATRLLLFGLLGVISGVAWDWSFPINKALWTSSYVLLTAGMAAMMLAALLWLVDGKGSSWWTQPFRVFGMNAILAYLCEEVVGNLFYNASIVPIGGKWVDLATALYQHVMVPLLPPKQASLAFALALVAFWYAVLLQFHRRGVLLKV